MKNVKIKALGLCIALIMVVCMMFTPAVCVYAAARNPYTYLVTDQLGLEWDAYNNKSTAGDASGNTIPTSAYIGVVKDPTESGRGGVLRIGNPDYPTSVSLRVSKETDVNYSHKLELNLYLDGEFSATPYVLIRDRAIWDNSTPYDQSALTITNMEKKKWVTVNTENAAAGVDGITGNSHHHIHDGIMTVVFDIKLAAGNYLYMDDFVLAAANSKTWKKNIDTASGDKIIYSNNFATFDEYEINRITKLDEWNVGAGVWAGTVNDGDVDGNNEIILYNKDAVYSGSITQNVIGLENGTYTLSVDCRSNGHSSAVIAADGFGEAKKQKTIAAKSDSMHTVTLSGLVVTKNYMYVSIWVGGQVGEWVIVDNVTLTKEESDQNFILNGDFESEYTATQNPAKKATRATGWNTYGLGEGKLPVDSIFIADEGYNSKSSMAVTYPADGGSNFNQTVLNLNAGATYVVSAYVKVKGTGDARLYFKNYGGSNTYVSLTKSDTWVKVYKEITLGAEGDRITLEFYCSGKSGDWFMIDNVKVVEKTNPTVNLVTNGDFETIIGDIDGDAKIVGADLAKLRTALISLSEANGTVADVNNDGNVDLLDLVRIKKFVAGENVILGE